MKKRVKGKSATELDYHIIGTGSSGNAVRIGCLMIDCGMPFKDMKEDLYKCKALLITHSHKDHIKPATFKRILEEFPRIKTYANYDVAYKYHINNIICSHPFNVDDEITVIPYEGLHDVPVTYFTFNINGFDCIYATDTCEIVNSNNLKFDYLFIESNYDEVKLKEIGKQYKKKGYDPSISNLRHLSTQKCKAFYYINRKSEQSKLIELHQSERFY